MPNEYLERLLFQSPFASDFRVILYALVLISGIFQDFVKILLDTTREANI
jgi:hypothetical protein